LAKDQTIHKKKSTGIPEFLYFFHQDYSDFFWKISIMNRIHFFPTRPAATAFTNIGLEAKDSVLSFSGIIK
jgi:hypothetical protein